MSRRSWSAAGVALVCVLAHVRVGAQAVPDGAPLAEYESTIDAALREFEVGRYPEALALFERAHAVSPSARTLRGIGFAAYETRDYPRAWAALRAALTHPVRALTETQRMDVQSLLSRTELFIARLELTGVPSGARVLVDGRRPVMDGVFIVTGPGMHTITVEITGVPPRSIQIASESGSRQRIGVEVVAQQRAPAPQNNRFMIVMPQRAARPAPPPTMAGAGTLSFDVMGARGDTLALRRGFRNERLCPVPCELRMDPGNYTFVILRRRGSAIVTEPLRLSESGRLSLEVTSRRRARARRLATGLVLMGMGAVGIVAGTRPLCGAIDPDEDCDMVRPAIGSGIAAASLGLALTIAGGATRDHGRVVFSSGRAPEMPPLR